MEEGCWRKVAGGRLLEQVAKMLLEEGGHFLPAAATPQGNNLEEILKEATFHGGGMRITFS